MHGRVLANLHAAAVRFVDGRPAGVDATSTSYKFFAMPRADGVDTAPAAVPYAASAVAVRIVADRVALPDTGAGMVPMLASLPADMAEEYASPARCLRPEFVDGLRCDHHCDTRKARVFASHVEYVRLLHRMMRCGMVRFTQQPRRVNGLFGVPKGDNAIRLILDARPQ